MCGIAGYIGRKNFNNKKIDQILNLMDRRGPDSKGFKKVILRQKQINFFFSRLSIIDKRKIIAARTENSMLRRDFRKKTPYFTIENKLFIENNKSFKVFITSAGAHNQLIIRQRLGYKNLGSWDIHRHFNPFIFFFNKAITKIKGNNIFKENLMSIISNRNFGNFSIKKDLSLKEFCESCLKNINSRVIEGYPCQAYLKWRFFDCPYHNYFRAIIKDNDRGEEVGIIWYEIYRGHGSYDIIIEYLSLKNKKEIRKILRKISFIFSFFCKARIIYRNKENSNSEFKNKKNLSKLLVYFNDNKLYKKIYFFDSFIRQGIKS